jgi:small Trp-rich protein
MFFVIVGVLLILTNLVGFGPTADWTREFTGDLWKFCVPFVFAALWWVWSDKTGLNKRREIERMDKKKADRRLENLASLGLDTRNRRKGAKR